MTSTIQLLVCFFLIFPLSRGPKNVHDRDGIDTGFADTTFVNWNKATLRSLNRQKHTKDNGQENPYYEDKIEAFMTSSDIDDEEKVNINAARYKFLKEITTYGAGRKDFYVVESDIPGQLLIVRNFVVYPADNETFNVDTYYFRNDHWEKENGQKKLHLYLGAKLKDNVAKQWEGFNHNDVIITRFKDDKVVDSEFFLFGTLSNASNIKALVDF